MFQIAVIVIVVIGVLLVLVVLAQNSKGGGMSSMMGGSGGGASQIIGAQKSTDFLEKATWGLAIAFMLLTVLTNPLIESSDSEEFSSSSVEKAKEQPQIQLPNANQQQTQQEAIEESSNEDLEDLSSDQ